MSCAAHALIHLGMRSSCQVLVYINLKKALEGKYRTREKGGGGWERGVTVLRSLGVHLTGNAILSVISSI